MDSLQDILGNKTFQPPDEIGLVKKYLREKFDSECSVKLQKDAVIISVESSALAGSLRLQQQELIKKCGLEKKRLIIRVDAGR